MKAVSSFWPIASSKIGDRAAYQAFPRTISASWSHWLPESYCWAPEVGSAFPSPALLRPLIEARIGYEVMDVAAACRTYNLLTSEGRKVAAALLFDRP